MMALDLNNLSFGPIAYFGFAAVLLVCFIVGLKKKPEAYEDNQWVWWTGMSVFAICIVYLVLQGFGIDILSQFR